MKWRFLATKLLANEPTEEIRKFYPSTMNALEFKWIRFSRQMLARDRHESQ